MRIHSAFSVGGRLLLSAKIDAPRRMKNPTEIALYDDNSDVRSGDGQDGYKVLNFQQTILMLDYMQLLIIFIIRSTSSI